MGHDIQSFMSKKVSPFKLLGREMGHSVQLHETECNGILNNYPSNDNFHRKTN
ncbi:GSCOCG00008880001-RA-CDS [Cotesia congregata]|nr:GSCOCG00008880001-RA-CDS [Cotesia congregata]